MGVLAGNANISEPKGMVAATAVPALVAVADLNKTQPLAVVIDGVVCPAGNTPPNRYQISTGPEVPSAAEKTLVMPVTKIGWFALISKVITDDPLFGVVAGIVVMVTCARAIVPNIEANNESRILFIFVQLIRFARSEFNIFY
jgi:hypothetical protein